MPHRRRVEKGSFGGQLDELIKVFPKKSAGARPDQAKGDHRDDDDRHINDKLFESAWRKKPN